MLLAAGALCACGDRLVGGEGSDPGRFDCEGFAVPPREAVAACGDVDAANPAVLQSCAVGSGHVGRWAVDGDGLPAYDFTAEERCDPAAHAYSPRRTPLRDPIHVVGNGRGLVAMAHASGAVEIYTQDRGHKWINRLDTWSDEQEPDYPPQLAGGFNYYAVHSAGGSRVGSTRFEDLPVGRAGERQTRRFGVGYVETVTQDGELSLRRRVLAPAADARALVAEVALRNDGAAPLRVSLVELWDVNLHQISVELLTSDLLQPGTTEQIDRRRRALAAKFEQRVAWDAEQRTALVETRAKSLPAGIHGRSDISDIDWFPDPIFLTVLDDETAPDAVWLSDDELWSGPERTPPASVGTPGDASSRQIVLDGAGQHALLAVRVPVEIAPHREVVRRFAFGYAPAGSTPQSAASELRRAGSGLAAATASGWRDRLVWAAFPGLPGAAAVQRELAWGAYSLLATSTYDELRGVRLLGQGGSYKYIHGLDGAMGDLALFAEGVALIDPALARDTLRYALATQHGPQDATPWRYPYATTGVGSFSDVVIYNQRSDAYYFLPAAIGRYVGLTRDPDFLASEIPYWPPAAGATGDVVDHLRRGLEYGTQTLGFGARGLVAMGTGDYADGINSLATEPATPRGTSSTYNAGAIVYGFPLAADLIAGRDPALADAMRGLVDSQSRALNERAWQGRYYYRGFVDSGNPLAPQLFFLEPQLFPILAGIAPEDRAAAALGEVAQRLETPSGALSNVAIATTGPIGGIDKPLVGGIWPVANAWLTAALAGRDPTAGWSSFARNTLAAHAEAYPDLWYGIWTGPDSFNGPDNPRPGEADAHLATALTDYPALNVHVHAGPLRALVDLVGVQPTRDGLRIAPRVPSESFAVRWPRLSVRYAPQSVSGEVVPVGDGPIALQIALPAALRQRGAVRVAGAADGDVAVVEDGMARFSIAGRRDERAAWQIDD